MTSLTTLPTPGVRGQAPETFITNQDAFQAALPTLVTEINNIVIPGAASLGASSIVGNLATGDDLDAAVTMGWFDIGSSTTNKPSGFGTGVCRVEVRGTGRVVQTALQVAGAAIIKKWTRVSYGASSPYSWGSWLEDYNQGSVIGTVSQTGGVPTGKLIEKGSSANGYYRRFACGFLECWITKAASAGAAVTWTFPSVFLEAPVVTGNAEATVSSVVTLDTAPTTTAVTYSARNASNARRADTCYMRATGRWSDLT